MQEFGAQFDRLGVDAEEGFLGLLGVKPNPEFAAGLEPRRAEAKAREIAAATEVQRLEPKGNVSVPQEILGGAVSTAPDMVIGGGLSAINPLAAMAYFGARGGLPTKTALEDKGINPAWALVDAVAAGGLDYLPFMKAATGGIIARIAKKAAEEGSTELAEHIITGARAKMQERPDMTVGEFVRQAVVSFGAGALAGGPLGVFRGEPAEAEQPAIAPPASPRILTDDDVAVAMGQPTTLEQPVAPPAASAPEEEPRVVLGAPNSEIGEPPPAVQERGPDRRVPAFVDETKAITADGEMDEGIFYGDEQRARERRSEDPPVLSPGEPDSEIGTSDFAMLDDDGKRARVLESDLVPGMPNNIAFDEAQRGGTLQPGQVFHMGGALFAVVEPDGKVRGISSEAETQKHTNDAWSYELGDDYIRFTGDILKQAGGDIAKANALSQSKAAPFVGLDNKPVFVDFEYDDDKIRSRDQADPASQRKPVAAMGAQELSALYYQHKHGIDNRRAWAEKQRQGKIAPFTLIADVKGFKDVNQWLKPENGDMIAAHIGRTLSRLKRNVAAWGGDEFLIDGNSKEELDALLGKLNNYYQANPILVSVQHGDVVQQGEYRPQFKHGTGGNFEQANRDLQQKSGAKLRGQRPRGIARSSATYQPGQNRKSDSDATNSGVQSRRAVDNRAQAPAEFSAVDGGLAPSKNTIDPAGPPLTVAVSSQKLTGLLKNLLKQHYWTDAKDREKSAYEATRRKNSHATLIYTGDAHENAANAGDGIKVTFRADGVAGTHKGNGRADIEYVVEDAIQGIEYPVGSTPGADMRKTLKGLGFTPNQTLRVWAKAFPESVDNGKRQRADDPKGERTGLDASGKPTYGASEEIGDPQALGFNSLNEHGKGTPKTLIEAIRRSLSDLASFQLPEPKRKSIRLALKKLTNAVRLGDMSIGEFVNRVGWLYKDMEATKTRRDSKPYVPLVRGSDHVRERLLEAKRRGDISEESANFAEWFILKNESLLDDVAISIKKTDSDNAGKYDPVMRLITLFKGSAADTTAVHEVLHHLERMMPAKMQDEIRKEWLRQAIAELKRSGSDKNLAKYLEMVIEANATGNEAMLKAAAEMISSGKVKYPAYRFLNPSEFWAVNMAATAQSRFRAKDSVWARSRQWLLEAIEHVKRVLGLASSAPLLRALNDILKHSDGTRRSVTMLADRGGEFNEKESGHYIGEVDEPDPDADAGLAPSTKTAPAAAPDAKPVLGTPERANPLGTKVGRKLVDKVDEEREANGDPEVQKDKEVWEKALARVNADYEGEKARIFAPGFVPDGAVDIGIGKEILRREEVRAFRTGDAELLKSLTRMVNSWRDQGADLARALRFRKDDFMTREERMKEMIRTAIVMPGGALSKKLRKLADDVRKGTPAGKAHAKAQTAKLLDEHARRIKGLLTDLHKIGVDITKLELEDLQNLPLMAKIIRAAQAQHAGKSDMLYEYWVNAVLSGPGTVQRQFGISAPSA